MTQVSNANQALAGKLQNEDIVDLGAFFSAIWRGKILILITTLLALAAAAYFTFAVAVPTYRSTAVVILETQQQSVVDLQNVIGGFSGDSSAINSEVEVLRARSLMAKVVDRLALADDPEFNATLREPTLMAILKGRIINSGPTAQPSVPEDIRARRERDGVINALLERVTIRNIPASFVFQITVETQSAQKSALVADTIVELYILNQIEVKFEATEQATSWLTDRVAELQVQLEEAEIKVSEFSTTSDLISVEVLQGLERQLKDLRDRTEAAEETQMSAGVRVELLTVAETREAQAEAANDPQLSRFLARAENDVAIATAFDTRFHEVSARAQLDATRASQQLATLRRSEEPLKAQITEQSRDLIALQQLQREAEANRLLYEYFLGRLKETSAQEGIQQADSRILSGAVIANSAATPRKPLILALAGILGIMLGSSIVLLREAKNNTFRSAGDLEVFTGQHVLGQIPVIPAKNRKNLLTYLTEKPTSAASEAIRNLRTSLLLSNIDKPPKVIVSTSAIPGEGKTTNSLALAHNLVGMGKRVLLIEGDIRRRAFSQYFDDIPKIGLVSILTGNAKIDDVIYRNSNFPVDLLVGEKTDTNAADIFSSDKFKELIVELRGRYDMIIIDTPPVLIVPDARIIAKFADAVLFTVRWDSTSKLQVDESMKLFRDANQKITGLVLAQISPKGMKRYGGEYGAYAGYGSKYYTN